jgi:spore germination protein GerM
VAFAQIVFTATETRAVTYVRLELDGRTIDVPTMERRLTADPVRRDDYALTAASPGSMTSS